MSTVIGSTVVDLLDGALVWYSGLAVDADGSPRAYHPTSSKGLDNLANARNRNGWCGVVTGPDGQPIVQGPRDPAPGYYVSRTSLVDPSKSRFDPRRYVDSEAVPYIAVPRELLSMGVRLGDVAHVEHRGRTSPAVVADVGPRGKIGEASIALAQALGIDGAPRTGGTSSGVRVVLFVGSATTPAWPRPVEAIALDVAARLAAWPGRGQELVG